MLRHGTMKHEHTPTPRSIDLTPLAHHDVFMRTTLTLDDAIAERLKADAAALGKPLKDVVNDALRLGLDALEERAKAAVPYRSEATDMGLREGLNYDDVAELLARAEREDFA
jgi:hypothetical protein